MNKRIKQLIKEGVTNFRIVNIILREFKKKRSQPILDKVIDIRANKSEKDLLSCYVCKRKITSPNQVLSIGKGLHRHKTGVCMEEVGRRSLKPKKNKIKPCNNFLY